MREEREIEKEGEGGREGGEKRKTGRHSPCLFTSFAGPIPSPRVQEGVIGFSSDLIAYDISTLLSITTQLN